MQSIPRVARPTHDVSGIGPVDGSGGPSFFIDVVVPMAPPAVPVNTALPTIDDTTPTEGELLTATNGSWTNSPTGFTYEWLRGAGVISGATSVTYTPVSADVGNTLSVRVTASNGFGAGAPATSAATSAVSAGTAEASEMYFETAPIIPTIQAAAYAIGNNIGGLQTVPIFTSTSIKTGKLTNIALTMLGTNEPALTLYIFSKNPTLSTFTDKGAFSIHNTDAQFLKKVITLTPFLLPGITNAKSVYAEMSLAMENKDTIPSINIYVAIEVGTAFTPAVGDMLLTFSGWRDV